VRRNDVIKIASKRLLWGYQFGEHIAVLARMAVKSVKEGKLPFFG
jgi:hypothetical protein